MFENSNLNSPVAFFQQFLETGYNDYRNDFFSLKGMEALLYEIDEGKKIKTFTIERADELTGEEYTDVSTYYFPEELKKLLNKESDISVALIDKAIFSASPEVKESLLTAIFVRLKQIASDFEQRSFDYEEYEILKEGLEELLSKLKIRYPGIIKVDSSQISNPSSLREEVRAITSFKMQSKYFKNIVILYEKLLLGEFIDQNTSIDAFKALFNGYEISSELSIKWIKTVKGKYSKPVLFYFINELISQELILPEKDFYTKIPYLFINLHGEPIKFISASKGGLKDRIDQATQKIHLTVQERELYYIIQEFKNTKLSVPI